MRFAVEPHAVARVLRDPKLTRIPKAPKHLSQVIYEAGRVVSVVSPAALFGAATAAEHASRVVLLDVDGVLLGLEASRVVGLLSFDTGKFTKPTATLEARVAPCVRGIAKDLTTVLDGAALTLALREH
jgi:chemotaxis signal transduction protein